MAKFKFPGVYIEETPVSQNITSLSSVAVFIGYTEKHVNINGDNILRCSTTVSSVLEFENFFGTAQPEQNIEIFDQSFRLAPKFGVRFQGIQSLHNLYYSVRSFFAQGGKSCRIVSVGNFKNFGEPLSADELLSGLEVLQSEMANMLICVPENQNLPTREFYVLQRGVLEFCKEHSAFAILDVPKTSTQNFRNDVANYRAQLGSDSLSQGAAFFPNLRTVYNYLYDESTLKIKKGRGEFEMSSLKKSDPVRYAKYKSALQQFFVSLPPSAAVAGAFLKTDETRGIWKAPANIALSDILNPEIAINNIDQDFLYIDATSGISINPIRTFTGRGTLIWGSRTLAWNDPEWKYISVRRFINQVEKDMQNSLETSIFDENSPAVWANIRQQTENYLMRHFSNGAFAGSTIRDAFFVHCGLGQTMTQTDVQNGILKIEIGLAPTRPAEFIIVRISQKLT